MFGLFKTNQTKEVENKINQVLFPFGLMEVKNDYTATWAVEVAYKNNPDVYAVLQQMASKTSTIPYFIKKVDDEYALQKYYRFRDYKHKNVIHQINEVKAKSKAFDSEYLPMPLERPNPLMGWGELIQLYKTYLRLTGNAFFYILRNEQNQPIAIYLLPAHKMKIIIKPEAFKLTLETPVAGYMLDDAIFSIPFLQDEVIHIKMPNPSWTFDAEQMIGLSPLKAAYLNVENQIQANQHIQRLFKSAGAIGVAYADNGSEFTETQARQFTQAIKEMDASGERMARIKAVAGKVGFVRMSLGNDEMATYDALKWDRKTICNVLGWQDELLNNDGTASLSSNEAQYARKIVLTDNVLPDLQLLEQALNKYFIPYFKGYEKTRIFWDISEMPEMQDDIKQLIEWADKAPITPNEIRDLIKFEPLEREGMDDVWISRSKIRMDEAMITDDFFAPIDEQED